MDDVNNPKRPVEGPFVWKTKGQKMPRKFSKGRQVQEKALHEILELLGDTPRRRDLLIEFLHLIQDRYGYLSAPHLMALAEELGISQAEIYEVATFYAHFDVVKEEETPPPPVTIRVCESLPCMLSGAGELCRALVDKYKKEDRKVRIVPVPCMGCCDRAPAVEIGCCGAGRRQIGCATVQEITEALDSKVFAALLPSYQSFDDYAADDGYTVLKALKTGDLSRDDAQNTILSSKLRGMGGAGFPSGKKWSFVTASPEPRYLAVNGDEGEPGTFKDRWYLEREPHLFLEGVLIAAWVVKAEKAFIYIRDEYPDAIAILKKELALLESMGVVTSGYVEIRRGAGAYICGEESAMIESIEGKKGLPRHRPPYVAQKGIFDRPTLVHNVETLCWVAKILRLGEDVYVGHGRNGRVGVRAFSVSGRVQEPGVKIASAGITVRELIDEYCGGMRDGHKLAAYLPGGASGGILPANLDNIPLDFDVLQEYECFIGSAAIVVLSDKDDIREAAVNLMRFFEHESCGQCTPCRVGCEKAVKLMEKKRWDEAIFSDLHDTMCDASICGLGQAAPNVFKSVMKHWPDLIGLGSSPPLDG